MKYFVFFFLCCVALASAAPQLLAGGWPGLVAPLGSRTVVAGPTVINGIDGLGLGRYISPGYVGVY